MQPKKDVLISKFSTIGLGGKADYFFDVESKVELQKAIDWCTEQSIEFRIVGGFSNLLFSDHGYRGALIRLINQDLEITSKNDTHWQVRVDAGYEWDEFVSWAISQDLAGTECLSGIPGKVGASPIQNIGAYGQDVSKTITEVEVYDLESKNFKKLSNSDCSFSYRNSRFKKSINLTEIIWSVSFELELFGEPLMKYTDLLKRAKSNHRYKQQAAGKEQLTAVRNTVLEIRKSKSMIYNPKDKNSRSLGSFFLNPVVSKESFDYMCEQLSAKKEDIPYFSVDNGIKISAAWLIEQAGFKRGHQYRGVGLSEKHSLAIINRGGSTKEVLELAEAIQQTIHEKYKIKLKPEPQHIP